MEGTTLTHQICLEPLRDPLSWCAADLTEDDWLYTMDDAVMAEIDALVAQLRAKPLPVLMLRADDFDLPACRQLMGRVKQGLLGGVGFALVDRLPMARLSKEEATTIYWILSQMICRPVAQKLDGTMIYDVHNTGQKALPGSGVRPDKTNMDLTFHNDNSYNDPMPDYVGLLCLQPARSGGISRVMSFHRAHNALLERYPEVLPRLYAPFVFDRQREHFAEDAMTIEAPVFVYDENKLSARLGIHQVRNGCAMTAQPMDDDARIALASLETVFGDTDLQFRFTMQAGQFQFVNNKVIGHSRTEFEDFDEPDERRHLVRLWLREEGGRSYQG